MNVASQKIEHPAAMLPLWDIVGSDIITTSGVVLRAMEIQGLDSEHAPGEHLLRSAECLYGELSTRIPEQSCLQFIMESHSDYSDVFSEVERLEQPDDPILALQHRRRIEFLRSSNLRRHTLYLFAGSLEGMSRAEFKQVTRASHQKRVAELDRIVKVVWTSLELAGIGSRALTEDEIEGVFHRYLNPGNSGESPRRRSSGGAKSRLTRRSIRARTRTVREQLMLTPLGPWHGQHLEIGNRYVRVLTLRDLPEETNFTLAEVFYSLRFDFRLSVSLAVPSQQKYRASLDQQRRFAAADAGRGGNIEDYKRTSRQHEGEELASLLVESGQRLVLLGAQAVISASGADELELRCNKFMDVARQKGLVFFEESYAHDREFFKTLPGMAMGSERRMLMTSNNAADLLPVFQECHGDREPVVLVKTSRDELFSYNPFAECRDNWNATIFGASGAGKSVFVNLMISTAVLSNITRGRLMVIDFAGEKKSSYLMIARMFGGRYIPVLSEKSDNSINPFPPPVRALDEHGDLKGPVLTFLTVLTDMLLANVGEDKDEQLYRRIMQKALRDTYTRLAGKTPIYSDLYQTLESYRGMREVDRNRLRVVLELMDGFLSGPAAKLFNRQSTIEDQAQGARFLILDLFGIDRLESHIAQAVTYVATEWVKGLAFDPNDQGYKYVILDEVAQLIKRQEMVGLLDELFSTSRKHRTSVWTVTQSYHSYRQSALANTVKLNSTTQIFLSHASDAQGRGLVAEDYQFNEREKVLFERLRTVKGKYSQALIKTEVEEANGGKKPITSVLNIELSPLDYQICTSDAADREIQNRYTEANPDLPVHEVLEHIAYDRHRPKRHPGRGAGPGGR